MSSANIWRAPGLAQARAHDAMHLPSIAMHGSSVNTAGMMCTSNTLTLCSCQTGGRVIKICQQVLHHLFVGGGGWLHKSICSVHSFQHERMASFIVVNKKGVV